MPMTESDLLHYLDKVTADEVIETKYLSENEDLLARYNAELWGDEEEDSSQVVTTDVQDVVESDMPSLARIFLGRGDILEFTPNTDDERDIKEAEEKTKYVDWIVKKQGFKVIHDWIKDAEIQLSGVVKFFYDERTEKETFTYEGITEEEKLLFIEDFQNGPNEVTWEEETTDDRFNITFEVEHTKKEYCIVGVPTEEFIITRNARSKDSAIVVGDRRPTTRGDLLAEGFDRETIDKMPGKGQKHSDRLRDIRDRSTRLDAQRAQDKQGSDTVYGHQWATEEVDIEDLYVLVDFDDDGIAERRRILRSGDFIIENEPYKIPPYAMMSGISMPHTAIGRSRASLVKDTQRNKSVLFRQIMENGYAVNAGRVIVNESETNLDDLEIIKNTGYVRTTADDPTRAVGRLDIPYIGDKALQIIQYVDSQRAARTGTLLQSQGLDTDNFYKETATRFQGVQDEGKGKIELVARVMAETGFKELYEGLAWTVSHFQNEATEIQVLGQPMKIDPRRWRFEHNAMPNVGLAIEDEEQQLTNMGALYQVQSQLKQQGSFLVDEVKMYNALTKVVKSMGFSSVNEFFNDPEVPEDQLKAMNEQLLAGVQALKQQAQNPLVEIENIKAQSRLMQEQMKQQGETQRQVMEIKNDNHQFRQELMAKLTELELKFATNVPGAGV